jgi:cytochrome P450
LDRSKRLTSVRRCTEWSLTPGAVILDYDPFRYYADPYAIFRRLRDEAPVYHNPSRGFWAFSRYEDVYAASHDWTTYSSAHGNDLDDTYTLWRPGSPESLDPPAHDRLRAVVQRHFSPRALRTLEPKIRSTVDRLLRRYAGERKADIATEVARPVPFAVICELLGFPAGDQATLSDLFDEMFVRNQGGGVTASAREARAALREYILAAAAERRRSPRADLLSAMVAAAQAGSLESEEIVGLSLILFVAGVTTTFSLITNSIYALAEAGDQRAKLVSNASLMGPALEELLRFEAPIQWLTRVVTSDVSLHGETIPANSRVVLLFASANRDERRWVEPDRLDFHRPAQRNLAFGNGIHFCVGASLARLEARIVVESVLSISPEYDVAGPTAPSTFTGSERGLASLPIAF